MKLLYLIIFERFASLTTSGCIWCRILASKQWDILKSCGAYYRIRQQKSPLKDSVLFRVQGVRARAAQALNLSGTAVCYFWNLKCESQSTLSLCALWDYVNGLSQRRRRFPEDTYFDGCLYDDGEVKSLQKTWRSACVYRMSSGLAVANWTHY